MTFLIDTNVISEIRKGSRCNSNVAGWYESIDDADLYLSVFVMSEIRKDIELARSRDAAKAETLEAWLNEVDAASSHSIAPHPTNGAA